MKLHTARVLVSLEGMSAEPVGVLTMAAPEDAFTSGESGSSVIQPHVWRVTIVTGPGVPPAWIGDAAIMHGRGLRLPVGVTLRVLGSDQGTAPLGVELSGRCHVLYVRPGELQLLNEIRSDLLVYPAPPSVQEPSPEERERISEETRARRRRALTELVRRIEATEKELAGVKQFAEAMLRGEFGF